VRLACVSWYVGPAVTTELTGGEPVDFERPRTGSPPATRAGGSALAVGGAMSLGNPGHVVYRSGAALGRDAGDGGAGRVLRRVHGLVTGVVLRLSGIRRVL
jgi:hypothetical protein